VHKLWTLADWRTAYLSGQRQLADLYADVAGIDHQDHAWIEIASAQQLAAQLLPLQDQAIEDYPLYGIPFAVKDNIDVAGFHTTAACPAASYLAEQDAQGVARLKQAGAIVIGKTNLDQFATGLVGVRSPYGAVNNSFHPDYISGGSSSGSAVVVANGVVPFALGTDTAGSGRVPAGHNHIVGLKPTKGWLSTSGLIPACRSIDVLSILALTVDDAWTVVQLMQGYDAADDYSRPHPQNVPAKFSLGKIAIPKQLEFFADTEAETAFQAAIRRLIGLGYAVEAVDFSVFDQLGSALYQRAWVAERSIAIQARVALAQLHPVVASIVGQAAQFSACDVMQDEYDRQHWSRQIQQLLANYDALMVPTAATIYRIAELEADPIGKNSQMGRYTNFVNLADLSALALPHLIRGDGLPSGVTFIAKAWHDQALADFGQRWQQACGLMLGRSQQRYVPMQPIASAHHVKLAVVGAHLSGMPLNHQLTQRAAVLLEQTHTAAHYKLYALKHCQPAKPGLQSHPAGRAIAVEVWAVPLALFGQVVAEVPAPLGIGNIQLVDGSWVKGFICEAHAIEGATDISDFGGWRAYLAALSTGHLGIG
jgi:allophanate hydrolase